MREGDLEKVVFGLFFGLVLNYLSKIACPDLGIWLSVYTSILGTLFGIFFYKTLHGKKGETTQEA